VVRGVFWEMLCGRGSGGRQILGSRIRGRSESDWAGVDGGGALLRDVCGRMRLEIGGLPPRICRCVSFSSEALLP
jgi:hypothetical protein